MAEVRRFHKVTEKARSVSLSSPCSDPHCSKAHTVVVLDAGAPHVVLVASVEEAAVVADCVELIEAPAALQSRLRAISGQLRGGS